MDTRPDRQILERLRRIGTCRVVNIVDIGEYQGRTYEIMEFAAGGSLHSLLRKQYKTGMSPDQIRQVAEQVGEGIAALHREGILHRDIKPPNILVRAEDPLDLAVSDFGISIAEHVEAFRETRRGSFGYKSPEQLHGHNHAPNDWWALGITIVEMATGRHPFSGLSDGAIASHLTQRAVPLLGITNPRVRLLCKGLLARESADRWGEKEVRLWAQGESPPVAAEVTLDPDGQPAPEITPLRFRGVDYVDRADLALGLVHSWGSSAVRLFASADPAWRRMRNWLAQFDQGHQDDIDARETELDAIERSSAPPNVRLVRVIRLLDPLLPPMYLRPDRPLTLATLGRLATDAVREDGAVDRQIVADLFDHSLLPELAHAREGEGLAELDGAWRALYREWDRRMHQLVGQHPPLQGRHRELQGDPRTYAAMLWLALSTHSAGAFLRTEAESVRGSLPAQPDWFESLLAPGNSPVEAAAAWLLADAAAAEALRLREDEDLAVREHLARAQFNDLFEEYRNQYRFIAMGWACVPLTIVMVVWIAAIVGADLLPFASDAAVRAAWAATVPALLVVACVEVLLAGVIGGPYHPRFSMLAAMIDRVARVANPVRRHGLLGILMIAGAATGLLALTTWTPVVLPIAVTPAHPIWACRRFQDWNRIETDLAERERQLAARHREATEADEATDHEQEPVQS